MQRRGNKGDLYGSRKMKFDKEFVELTELRYRKNKEKKEAEDSSEIKKRVGEEVDNLLRKHGLTH